MRLIRRSVLGGALACAALAVLAGGAAAVHWPFFGGDNGRSGHQPVGEGIAPVELLYSRTADRDRFVKTSPLTTTGSPTTMRVVYGTVRPQEAPGAADRNGRVHLRVLGTGAAVGPEEGVPVDDGNADADVFGPGAAAPAPASVSFADTSGPSGLGQVFAVHNDDDQSPQGDIAIAQIDESDGALVKDEPIGGTDGFTINSSAVATGPMNADGDRVLFFVAESGDDERLFRVPVDRAGARNANVRQATSTADIDADPQASPTLIFLRDPNGDPKAHVAVGAGAPDERVETYAVSDLSAGPTSGDLGGSAQTPSVPVQPSGMTPSPDSDVKTAPFVYVAAATGDSTTVYKLIQQGNEQSLSTAAKSGSLAGSPAPALALTQEAVRETREAGALANEEVLVTTGRNLYVLKTNDLALAGRLDAESDLAPGTTGFGQTTAAASGPLGYVTTDEGRQIVFRVGNARPLAESQFDEADANRGDRLDNSGMGQPSIARGIVQFGSQKGLFVYRNRCGNDVDGGDGADRIVGTLAGDDISAADADDVADGGLADDCQSGGAGGDTLSGGSGRDSLDGGDGVDRISGDDDDDVLKGRGDRDLMTGDTGADNVDGVAGSNIIDGGAGNDFIRGGERADSLNGGSDGDRIFGGDGNDGISGASGQDRLFGGKGDDRIEGGLGTDVVSGGDGGDNIVSIDGQPDVVNCGRGRDVVRADGGDTIRRNCERVIQRPGEFGKTPGQELERRDLAFAGEGGQKISGDGSPAELRGGPGGDTIDSPISGDRLFGLGGPDLLSGGSGDDRADGGEGVDVVSGGPGADTLLGGDARDFVEGGPGDDRLEGQQGSNVMNGAQGDDVLIGGNFADALNGGSDEDVIRGGTGGDGITGASGRDRLFGEDGDDRIEGGLGSDEISGGDGGDSIVAADGQRDEIDCGAGDDVVRADGDDDVARDCELVIARVGERYVVVRR